jgi:hypothetical protein
MNNTEVPGYDYVSFFIEKKIIGVNKKGVR